MFLRLKPQGCNPGNLKTELARHQNQALFGLIGSLVLYPSIYGSYTQLFANTAPEAAELNGRFLVPWSRVGREHADTNKQEQQDDRELRRDPPAWRQLADSWPTHKPRTVWNYCEEYSSKF